MTRADIEFAHDGQGFPTWHRLYMLAWGKKPCRKLVTMKNFAISYWDWTGSKTQCDPAICSEELLGVTNQVDGTVKGKYFDNMLRIICSEHHSEESWSFGRDPHSDQCIIIHVVIMDCVLLVGA